MPEPEVTTETIDEKGRLTVNRDVRELLGIDGRRARLRLEIEVREVLEADGDDE